MHTRFEHFDLESGTPLPRFKSMAFFSVVYRAKKLLRGFSAADVEAIAASIPKIKHLPGYFDPLYETLTKWDPMPYMDPKGVVSDAVPSTSDVSALIQNIGRVDVCTLVPQLLSKCTWQLVFATIALLYVDEALGLQRAFDEHPRTTATKASRAELLYLSEVAESALAAIEAVTAAELGKVSLLDLTVIEEHTAFEKYNAILHQEKVALQARLEKQENQRKSIARKGGYAKNAPMRGLVADFMRFYNAPERTFKSNSQAVDLFLGEQSAERLKVFAKTNVKRALLKWLREVKKGDRTILPST